MNQRHKEEEQKRRELEHDKKQIFLKRLKDQQADNKIRKEKEFYEEQKEADMYWKKLDYD